MSEPTSEKDPGRKYVCFCLGTQQLGAPIEHVKETIVTRPITKVFLTPRWISGIINLRGDVVAVLDLSAFLGMAPTQTTSDTRIVIARAGEPPKTAGLLVDRLAEVRWVTEDRVQAAPPTIAAEAAELIEGVATLDGGEPMLLLDLPKVFSSERLRQFERKAG